MERAVTAAGCDEPGCTKPHRARGKCSTHYNRLYAPKRHQRTITCQHCGAQHQTTSSSSRYCSLSCRDAAGLAPDGWLHDSIRRATFVAGLTALRRRIAAILDNWLANAARQCADCHTSIADRSPNAVLCRRCTSRRADRRKRGRRAARRREIFERDHWLCHLCGEPTNPDATVPDLDAPTIDHLVPWSVSHDNSPGNLATAHYLCNTLRGATPLAYEGQPTPPPLADVVQQSPRG